MSYGDVAERAAQYAQRIMDLERQRNAARSVLQEIVGQARPNRWGYDAAGVALDDDWRARARAALALLQ